jgi:ATP-dependent DNA helicase RecG
MITLLNEVSKISPLANKYNAQLERLSISTVRDLLWHLPLRYEDYSNVSLIDNLRKGDDVVVVVKIVSIVARRGWRSKKNITEAIIEDDSGQMKAVWFNQPYLTKVLTQGSTFYLSGKVIDFYGLTLSNPTHERFDKEIQALHFGNLTPIYPSTQRLTQKLLRFFISSALKKNPNIVEHIDEEFLKKEHMLTLPEAVKNIHFPKSHEVQQQAVYRLKFEELWQVQEKSRELRKRLEKLKGHPLASNESSLTSWLDSLSFELTPGQKEAWKEISRDIEKPYPMIRLLQGEVGSGKTIVAASALYKATLSGSQGAIMTPTEVLSNQHFETFASLFKNFDVTIALLTRTSKLVSRHGNVATSTRDSIKKGIRAGTLDIVIGTHALIQTEVAFKRLALIVVDEQQRFGVKQRLEIVKKNKDATIPHMLALTATPIPRTYTHFLYGAIDVSVLSDMPKGRKKIITKLVKKNWMQEGRHL